MNGVGVDARAGEIEVRSDQRRIGRDNVLQFFLEVFGHLRDHGRVELRIVAAQQQQQAGAPPPPPGIPLSKFQFDSLAMTQADIDEMNSVEENEVYIMGEMFVRGQVSILWAASNTGKALISLAL